MVEVQGVGVGRLLWDPIGLGTKIASVQTRVFRAPVLMLPSLPREP
jgi:hypothetical protein